MAIHPNSYFPILPSDQADVIRIFLDLMRERYPAGPESEITTDRPMGSRSSADRAWLPGELLDLD